MTIKNHFQEDALLSAIATAIGEPARTRILVSLLDGHARTSTELAVLADVTPSTASAHLTRLRETNLIRVAAQGRHRYYSLQSPDVARALEALSVLAGATTKNFVPSTPEQMRKARSCYDHIAGALGVALHDQFFRECWLVHDPDSGSNSYELSTRGIRKLERLRINIADTRKFRRRFAYGCLDWSERRPHIAGALGAALLSHAIQAKWVIRELDSRALCLTRSGEREMLANFGIRLQSEINVEDREL